MRVGGGLKRGLISRSGGLVGSHGSPEGRRRRRARGEPRPRRGRILGLICGRRRRPSSGICGWHSCLPSSDSIPWAAASGAAGDSSICNSNQFQPVEVKDVISSHGSIWYQ
ncbi:unnamed protein product [Urochloa humidicola]